MRFMVIKTPECKGFGLKIHVLNADFSSAVFAESCIKTIDSYINKCCCREFSSSLVQVYILNRCLYANDDDQIDAPSDAS